jgi:hypothetical protein
MENVTDQRALVIYHTGDACRFCEHHINRDAEEFELRIESATARESGYQLEGSGAFGPYCSMCGAQINLIRGSIPIHCVGLLCGKCGKPDHLEVNLKKVAFQGKAFKFTAILECTGCKSKRRFATVLKKVTDLLSIEIGPGGITVKSKGLSEED